LRNSRRNGACRSSCDGYTRSVHPRQLYGPSQIRSAFEMTNAGESSPFFGQDGSEIQLHAPCKTDSKVKRMAEEQIPKKMGATFEPNQSGQRNLRKKEFLEGTTSIQRRGGSSTSDSHFKLVQQMKYTSAHPFLRLGKYYLRDQRCLANHCSRRKKIMRNVEKTRALDIERGRH
jgi:hypothetical protein